jgi:hypothetical protein
VATGLAKRIEAVYLQNRNRVYSVDVQRALKNYQHHLDTVEDGLEEREAMLRGVVEEFDEVGSSEDGIDGGKIQSGLMREVGKRYGEVLREIEIVKAEMKKLRGDAVEKQSRSGRRGGRVSGAWG